MSNNIPNLDASAWEINGSSMTAWINDFEFYEISPGPVGDHYLTLNNAATATSEALGWAASFAEAQEAAREHLGDSGD